MAGNPRRVDTRIGHDARAAATSTLDVALRDGRFDLAEYERRLVLVQAAKVRKDLTPAIADLPTGSGRSGPTLRISAADRERALVLLADSLTDGRIEARAYADAEELLSRAVTYADVDAVVSNLDAKASHTERDHAIARIEAAVAAGLLEPAEQHDRVAAVRRATTDAQLAALVADLPVDAGAARSPRASHADREAVIARLHDALEAGLIDLSEFDERTRAAYAARLHDELARVVADLPSPAAPTPAPAAQPAPPAALPPAPPVVPSSPKTLARAANIAAMVAVFGGFLVMGIAAVLTNAGLTALAVPIVVAAVVTYSVWAWRSVRAAMAADDAYWKAKANRPAAQPSRGDVKRGGVAPKTRKKAAPRRKRLLSGHKGGLTSVTGLVLPDGTPLAITGGKDNTAKVWDLSDDSLRHTLSGHTHDVRGVAAMVLPDGVPVAVTVSPDRTARVWDLRDGTQRGTLSKSKDPCAVRCLSLADGTPVAIIHGGIDAIQMWDLRDHSLLDDFTDDETFDKMVPVLAPDGTPLALISHWEGELRAVNLKTGKTMFRLRGHTQQVNSIDTTVFPDGTPVAVTASMDKTVCVWDLQRRALLRTIDGMTHADEAVVCTSLPDGTPIAVACNFDENATAWDLRTGSALRSRPRVQGLVVAAVALPDQALIVGPSADYYPSVAVHPLT